MSGLIGQTDCDVSVRVRALLCYSFVLKIIFELVSKTSFKFVCGTVFEQTSHAEALMCQD